MRRRWLASTVAALAIAAQPAAQQTGHTRPGADAAAATASYFQSIRHDPSLLLAFLTEMPKGGDLHNHLSGGIYAESYLRWAAADHLCVATATMTITPGPCDAAAGRLPADTVVQNADLYSRAIDAMSMRNWDRTRSGHDHFFATFGRFGPAAAKLGDMLAELAGRAAAEHTSYLEVTLAADGGLAGRKGAATDWDGDADLPRLRQKLLEAGVGEATAAATRRIDDAEARQRDLLRCGTPHADAGCQVVVRYVAQVLRSAPPATVFAEMIGAFESASHDARVVAINLVAPEDGPVAVRDFALHMRMLDYLHKQYPRVAITLHAGELVDGLVAPETLRFHIAQSVRTGHARRIGHGVDIMYEDNALDLLREMAANHVLVEVALTSNDVILGVRGSRHPLRTYLKFGVPVALVTDDAGVSRSSLTLEYRKAVEEHDLDYPTLKWIARNSIAFGFADGSTRARLQADLDRAFRAFEAARRTP